MSRLYGGSSEVFDYSRKSDGVTYIRNETEWTSCRILRTAEGMLFIMNISKKVGRLKITLLIGGLFFLFLLYCIIDFD